MKTKKKSSIEVSKNGENEDIKLSNRIIDLFIWYQIEGSNAWLRVLKSQVKFLEERRKQLFDNLDMCLFKFQKKKINEELEQIEKELFTNKNFSFIIRDFVDEIEKENRIKIIEAILIHYFKPTINKKEKRMIISLWASSTAIIIISFFFRCILLGCLISFLLVCLSLYNIKTPNKNQ